MTTSQVTASSARRDSAGLTSRLIEMGKIDQSVRSGDVAKPTLRSVKKQVSTDRRLTHELKQIVASGGWPTTKLVGPDASDAAAMILVHSRDRAFQRKMLPQLRRPAGAKEIDGSKIALLTDKLLLSDGRPQRFGTQFKLVDDHWELLPVEDPSTLDSRRARYSLPPMAEYRKQLAEAYRVPVR